MYPPESEASVLEAAPPRRGDDGEPGRGSDDTGSPPSGPAETRSRRRRGALEWLLVIVIAVGGAILIRTFVVQTFSVPSSSMFPTLQIGDRILVNRIPGLAHSIQRGDVIVFHKVPADHDGQGPEDLVKRVIGLPGERISSVGDTVYIDGKPIREPYLDLAAVSSQGACAEKSFGIPAQTIPAGRYFVMGDCRGISDDSRFWGTVPISSVIGKVVTVIWRHNHPWIHWI
jgi:signal peptidase I